MVEGHAGAIGAFVNAATGLLGVIIGSAITIYSQARREKRQQTSSGTYLAASISLLLDDFLEACARAAADTGELGPDRETMETSVPHPCLAPYPTDIDWKSIDPQMMYRIIALRREVKFAEEYIQSTYEHVAFPPDYDDLFIARTEQFSKLGKTAAALSSELRKSFGLPKADFGGWSPLDTINRELKRIEDLKARYAADSPVMPPPPVPPNPQQ